MNIPKSTLEVRRCCAEEGTNLSIDGMRIVCNKSIGSVCATDGRCLLVGTWDRPSAWGSADVGRAFDEVVLKTNLDIVTKGISKRTKEVVVSKKGKQHLDFVLGGYTRSLPTVQDKRFPNTEGIIPHYDDKNSTSFTVNIETLAKLIDALAAALENESSQVITLKIPHKQGRPMKVISSQQHNDVRYVGVVMPCKEID